MTPINHQYKDNGFTLAELLIVIAMIAVLMAIGATQLKNFLPGMRLKSAARELYSNMQKARMSAIKEDKNWAIVFDPANNRYYVCSDPGVDGTWSATADNTIALTVDLSSYQSGVKFGHGNATSSVPGGAFPAGDVSYSSDVLSFSSQGTGSAGYVYLANQNNTTAYAVGSQTSGVISLFLWQGGKWQ